jgi:molybdopterin molybdotransferase
MLQALLQRWPVETTLLPLLPDDRAATEQALAEAAENYDLILSTGGVSVGDHDHVRPALETLGSVLFWRLPLRPGRPVLLGRIGDCHLLGLPGNPVSVLATFALIGRPVLAALAGMRAVPGTRVPVTLAQAYVKPVHLNEFVRAQLQPDGSAILFRSQGSNLLSSLSWADGLLDMPAGQAAFAAGETVFFLPFAGLLD